MKAEDVQLTQLFEGPKQFIVPIFQRDYSWGTKHCLQLWNDMRHCHYLLDRMENDSKEKIDTSTFTIEHVLPQNEDLNKEWRAMLGENWKEIQDLWLHRLGNITLTGYNSKYSDLPFEDKKTVARGFNESPLRLNKFIREQTSWTPVEIDRRGKELATRAVSIWPSLVVDMQSVKISEQFPAPLQLFDPP